MAECAAACAAATGADEPAECKQLVASGRCQSDVALVKCRSSCFRALKANHTEDLEGNCFYWATDGECEANQQWMHSSCARSCELLHVCRVAPESEVCARQFECPLERDKSDAETCAKRARRGECRPESIWSPGNSAFMQCTYSCAILDPMSVSKTVTRPMVKRSAHIDPHVQRHRPTRCHHVGLRHSVLDYRCPNLLPTVQPHALEAPSESLPADARLRGSDHDPVPWRRRWRRCPRVARAYERMTPRIQHDEVPPPATLPPNAGKTFGEGTNGSTAAAAVRVQVISASPRVRLLHNFVTPYEAAYLIKLAEPHYHRSSTARAGSDNVRTSHSSTLMSSDPIVAALRHRIAFYSGYHEPNIEPLQTVRYRPGEFYKVGYRAALGHHTPKLSLPSSAKAARPHGQTACDAHGRCASACAAQPHHDYYNSCETWVNGNRHFTFLIYLNDVEEGGETAFPVRAVF